MSSKILLVDDQADLLKIGSLYLEEMGYDVTTTTSPHDVLHILKSETPDLIISDLIMPKMDGLELYKKIRNDKSLPFIPFIILTSITSEKIEEFSFSFGVDEYLTKPIHKDSLKKVVAKILKETETFRKGQTDKLVLSGKILRVMDDEMISNLYNILLMRRTGVFEAVQNQVLEGYIWIRDGQFVDASCIGLNGVDAIKNILEFNAGEYLFLEKDLTGNKVTITDNSMNVLMDLCKRIDEKRVLRYTFLSKSS
jgi:CheY-like chemotaxis protein